MLTTPFLARKLVKTILFHAKSDLSLVKTEHERGEGTTAGMKNLSVEETIPTPYACLPPIVENSETIHTMKVIYDLSESALQTPSKRLATNANVNRLSSS